MHISREIGEKRTKIFVLLFLFGNVPFNWRSAAFFKKGVDLGEGTATEKAAVGREWGRMCGFKDEVTWVCDQFFFALGVCTPQKKRDGMITFIEKRDDAIGKRLPADARMAVGEVCAHGERSV